MKAAAVTDYRARAKRSLPNVLFEYLDGGAYAEETLHRNVADFRDVQLRQRVMKDVSKLSLSTSLFGENLSMPIALAPVGLSGFYARRGEVQAARAARAAGVQFTLSTVSVCSIEEVRTGLGAPFWFQLYMLKDRGYMRRLIERAREAECRVLLFTVDLAVPGARYRDIRSGLSGDASAWNAVRRAADGLMHLQWLWDVWINGGPHVFGNLTEAIPEAGAFGDFWAWIGKNFDPAVTWADIDWVREQWAGPIVLKGILDEDDARTAVSAGADGIVVSNHGGRQLDSVMSGVQALPAIAEAVGERLPVLLDGGVRSGLDVLKALALGADACLLGRAWAYALAADGGSGVAHMLTLIRAELEVAMALTGCTDVRTAGGELLVSVARNWPRNRGET